MASPQSANVITTRTVCIYYKYNTFEVPNGTAPLCLTDLFRSISQRDFSDPSLVVQCACPGHGLSCTGTSPSVDHPRVYGTSYLNSLNLLQFGNYFARFLKPSCLSWPIYYINWLLSYHVEIILWFLTIACFLEFSKFLRVTIAD